MAAATAVARRAGRGRRGTGPVARGRVDMGPVAVGAVVMGLSSQAGTREEHDGPSAAVAGSRGRGVARVAEDLGPDGRYSSAG
ncbi:hypothetical protein GCM10017752_41310 [Streptomyces roseoviridis]